MLKYLKRDRRANLSLAAALALAAGAAGSLASGPQQSDDARSTPRVPSSNSITLADSLSAAFREATSAISPSVVNITTVQRVAASPGNLTQQPDMSQIPEEFRRFFDFGNEPRSPLNAQPGPMPERRGQGSGVIIRSNGYILTNNHVVEDAGELKVRLDNGREYDATVVGTDPESDLAVIKIEAEDLPAARFGNSDNLQPGDWVVAVGNPFGLDHTVTAGVVSGTGRAGMGLNTYEDFIQTDAAINPGNSGGPMINLHGEVVGINAAIRSSSGGSIGIGFAIPSSIALNVADSLIEHGTVQRGWLGVSIQPLTPELASSFDYEGSDGALIAQVRPDTPAAKAGLEAGDIVTRVGDRAIDSPQELMNTIARYAPGEKVTLTIAREGETRTNEVKLGERPSQPQLVSGSSGDADSALGMQVQPLTEDLAEQLGLDAREGLIITQVEPGSPAADAGLQPEDVILEAARKPVRTAAELAQLSREHEDGLLLKVSRDARVLFLVVKHN